MDNLTTTVVYHTEIPVAGGFIAVLVTVILFGSNLIPVKKFETGNGIFYQWVLSSAIWMAGLITYAIRGFPKFNALAMIGGFLWSTGNIMVVPIIKTVGIAQGCLIWGSLNLLSGWASSRFGWFNTKAQIPINLAFNYAGVALCLLSAICYLFLKTSTNVVPRIENPNVLNVDNYNDDAPLLDEQQMDIQRTEIFIPENSEDIFSKLSLIQKKILGIILSIFAGILFGLNFVPVTYQQDNDPAASKNGLDYVFPHFCGIYLTSTVYFLIYCIVSCNKPGVFPRTIFPAFIAGMMWAIAQIGWFIANDVLSEPVSFPIITTVPGIIGTLWGIFFKEIRGCYNYLVLLVAFTIAITGSVLTGISKVDFSNSNHTLYDLSLYF